MKFQIRAAKNADWAGVSRLLIELGRPAPTSAADEDDFAAAFQAYLRRRDAAALVAVADEKVVGFINVEYRLRLNRTAPEAWIAELVVADERRGSGAGAALLAAAERTAREHGCRAAALESATWRSDAHRFYQREGWTHSALAFTKDFER